MRIFDCFMFLNEFDLLELRKKELESVPGIVFVAVQAAETFTGNPRNWVKLDVNVNHQLVYLEPEFTGKEVWEREAYQRNQMLNAIKAIGGTASAESSDLMMISDCDEIPRASTIKENLEKFNNGIHVLLQDLFYYNVNQYVECWRGTAIGTVAEIERAGGPQKVRDARGPNPNTIENGGWHFSYFGGIEAIRAKTRSFSHGNEASFQELAERNERQLIADIVEQRDVVYRPEVKSQYRSTDDPRLPQYFLQNPKKFDHFTHEYFRNMA